MKYDVVFLRSGYGKPDSRMEKEIISLSDNGIKVYVIAWNRDSENDEEHLLRIGNHDIPFYHIGIKSELAAGFKKNLIPMFRFNIRIYGILKRMLEEYAIIHASDFDTVMPAFLIKKRYGKKLIYDIYDYYADSHHMPGRISKLVKTIDTRIINCSDAVFLCNEKRLEQIRPANPKRIAYIHNTPFDVNFEQKEKNNESRIKIVYIGGLIEKGRYIKELLDVVSTDERFDLIVGGYGYFEDYVKKMSSKFDNIKFIGKLSYDEVLKIESQSDIMTALYDPSLKNHQYAAPNKFYEGLMAGKPLIVARDTYIDTVIKKENIGWVLEETDEKACENLKSILNSIYDNRENLVDMGNKMKRIYKNSFRWKVMEERMIRVYSEIKEVER